MSEATLVVTYDIPDASRATVMRALDGAARLVCLAQLPEDERSRTLAAATVVLARNTAKELREGEEAALAGAKLIQFVSAGVDFIPLSTLPRATPIACNGGGYAEPMAEHGLAMTLAAAKRLFAEHQNMQHGEFNQFVPTRLLAGRTAGILGLGGIGIACAKLFKALGMQVHAINRRGVGHETVDWVGTPDDLGALLSACDVLILSLPLTKASERLMQRRELELMKSDAILVNLARGEIIDEAALYQHLTANPDFTACIDAWWVEPARHGEFRTSFDFLALPNVIASPHNSASTEDWNLVALERAITNIKRVLSGQQALHLVGDDERMR